VKYEPKHIDSNVNVSPTHPLKELFFLLGGVLVILILVYVALGFAVDLVVPRLPVGVEESLGHMYAGEFSGDMHGKAEEKLQSILDKLMADTGDVSETHYQVHLVNSPVVNAMAVPGGNIVIFSGLLGEMDSENELAFVLGHELGHFKNRDHLKGLGRGLVLTVISATVLGENSDVTKFLMDSLIGVEMKFSQRQELAADSYALDLMEKTYGSAAGSEAFFESIDRKRKSSRLLHYFASHPHPRARMEALEKRIAAKGYGTGEKTPLDAAFDPWRKKEEKEKP